ncbi:MAG TPA: S8 family serine peptidase, partial [Candidatus Polarisedimenticolia bacterium]|nr:S8 family serine peptidase [Candidatus Polarisedimenticolia bacterium]
PYMPRSDGRAALPCLLLLASAALAFATLPALPAAPVGPALPGIGSGFAPAGQVPGEIIVKFRPTATGPGRESARTLVHGLRRQQFRSGAELWSLQDGVGTEEALTRLRTDPHVQYAEPNYLLHTTRVPSDTRFAEQYALRNTGQLGGTPGADISATSAWDVSTGSPAVVVAVIDTGVDYTHPDLAANIYINDGEIAGNNLDDDGNGFVDDVRGWDFVNHDNDPIDDAGHGTHVAGTIGAVSDNGAGVAGVAWQVRLMPIKFLGAGGSGTTADAISSIDYATLMGVDIMSNSWGGGGFSQAMLDAIRDANDADILFVAAAGNNGTNTDVSTFYPADYDAPNILSVAATDRTDHLASFSNYGVATVDLAAPGVDILSTLRGGGYGLLSGTSMATPHVSGAAALIRSVAPDIDVAHLRQRILSQVDPIPGLAGSLASGGRLNAFLGIAQPDDVPPGTIDDLAVVESGSNSLRVGWTATGDDGDLGTASGYDLRYSVNPIDAANFDVATRVTGVPSPAAPGSPEEATISGLSASTLYYVAVRARDEWGQAGPLGHVAVGTTEPPPTFDSAPPSFSAALLSGQKTTRTLTVRNAGVGTLDWNIPRPAVGLAGLQAPYAPLALGKGEPDPRAGAPVVESAGGPDPFGYRWIDSDDPGGPDFVWNDIRTTGTIVGIAGDDSTSGPIPIGFEFPFYDGRFTSVRVCTNGWISFTSASASYVNQPLPSPGAPENLIAAFWDDLYVDSTSKVIYARTADSFTVQFDNIANLNGTGPYTFQIVLRTGGRIEVNYLLMRGTLTGATVGIQDATTTRGLQVVFNASYVHDSLALTYSTLPDWLSASPTSGTLHPGEEQAITVGIDATGLEAGSYGGRLTVQSNDPDRPSVDHPVTLSVTAAPAIAALPPAVDFGTVFHSFASDQVVRIRNTGTAPLAVTSVELVAPEVSVDGSPFTLARGQSRDLTLRWSPAAPVSLDGRLTIVSDASNAARLEIPLQGVAIPPPAIRIFPTSYSETLFTGGVAERRLAISNDSPTPLELHLQVVARSAGLVPGPFQGLVS